MQSSFLKESQHFFLHFRPHEELKPKDEKWKYKAVLQNPIRNRPKQSIGNLCTVTSGFNHSDDL
ncbi:hypothetical protein C6A37_04325 [Desulfobacteraceae bacterium SEEP-SAG9]|nr:hypothetical protein C6A37_04325 [Desulfobacteraceae bacterium SEEP-SAG9]